MAAPSIDELKLLEEFRLRLKDLDLNENLNSDMELLRWIRAREKDLDQAELMLRKHLKWRDENSFDQLNLWEMPKTCEELLPEKIIGFDYDNCPVLLSPNGKWDLKRALQEVGPETCLKSKWKILSSLKEAMANRVTSEGVPVTQYCVVSDLEGLSISQGTLQVLQLLSSAARMFEANFPEHLKVNVTVNAPWFFPVFYKCVKPFLNEKTKAKVHVFGKNREEWSKFLGSMFPPNVLPSKYGGSNDVIGF